MVNWSSSVVFLALVCIEIALLSMFVEAKPMVLIVGDEEDGSPKDLLLQLLHELEQKNVNVESEDIDDIVIPKVDQTSVETPSKRLCPKGYFTNPFHSCKPSLGKLRGRGRKHRLG